MAFILLSPVALNIETVHVTKGLPLDIKHEYLEGVVPFEMALVLRALISKGYFDVSYVNMRIHSWKYRDNKPVEITESFTDYIKQNAGRMWCLLCLHH